MPTSRPSRSRLRARALIRACSSVSPLFENLESRLLFSSVPVGVNIEAVTDFSASLMFVDAMKSARGFGSVNSPWDDAATVDANGWPTEDSASCIITLPTQYSSTQKLPDIGGTYHFSATGYCQVGNVLSDLTITDWNYNAATNTTTADVNVAHGATQVYLSFTDTNHGIQNIKLIRPGYAADTTQVYTNAFLNSIANVSALRLMDFERTNGNPVVNWSDRSQVMDATQTSDRGVAWEYVVDLANEAHKDIWINIPVGATDDYVTHLAELFKTTLDPSLHVYVEYSNEVWNSSFPQSGTNYNAAQTEEAADPSVLDYDGSNNTYYYAWRRVAERIVQISNDFASVYGESAINTTIRPILASQIGWSYVLRNQLEFMNAVYGSPSKYIYGVAGAPYIGISSDLSNSSSLTVDQIIASLEQSISGNMTCVQQFESLAQDYGLQDFCYEGGVDLEGDSGGNFANAKIPANYDPRMATVITDYLNMLYSNNVSMLMYYSLGGSYTPSGTWGLTEDLATLTGPKYTAFNDFAQGPMPAITGGNALPATVGATGTVAGGNYIADQLENAGSGGDAQGVWTGDTYDYVINASNAGDYSISLTSGSWSTGNPVYLIMDGVNVGTFSLIGTASGDYATTNSITLSNLAAGMHTVRLVFPNGGYDLQSLNFTNLNAAPVVTSPSDPVTTPTSPTTPTDPTDPTSPTDPTTPIDPTTPTDPTSPTTPTDPTPVTTPTATPVTKVATLSSTQIALSWNAIPAATAYIVQRSKNGKTGWQQVGITDVNTLTYTDQGLTPATKYFYQVTALNSAGFSPFSAAASAKTLAITPPHLSATLSTTGIVLSWKSMSGAGSYLVQRRNGNQWITVTTLGAAVASYTDTSVSNGKAYTYRLVALDTLNDPFYNTALVTLTFNLKKANATAAKQAAKAAKQAAKAAKASARRA